MRPHPEGLPRPSAHTHARDRVGQRDREEQGVCECPAERKVLYGSKDTADENCSIVLLWDYMQT